MNIFGIGKPEKLYRYYRLPGFTNEENLFLAVLLNWRSILKKIRFCGNTVYNNFEAVSKEFQLAIFAISLRFHTNFSGNIE